MKIKNPDTLAAFQALSALIQPGNVVPGLSGLRTDRNVRMLEPIAMSYETKRIEIIQRLGTQDADGNWAISPADKAWAKFQEEFEPIAAEEHEINLYVIPLAEILKGYSVDGEGKTRLLNFSGAHMGVLDRLGIIVDSEPKPPAACASPRRARRQRRPR